MRWSERVWCAAQIVGDADLDVAAEMLYGLVYYRWLLRTGPVSQKHADTVVAITLRALGCFPTGAR